MYQKYCSLVLFIIAIALSACEKNGKDQPNTDPDIKGCGNFQVLKIMESDKVLSIFIDHNQIEYSTDFQEFDHIENKAFATIKIEQNCDIQKIFQGSCNDVFFQPNCQSVMWTLQSGKLSFRVNKVLDVYLCGESYLATVVLQNAVFKNEQTGEIKTYDNISLENVNVGWCAG